MTKRWVGCSTEEEYFGDDRKLGKSERKLASAKDRSKYKKTDLVKMQKKALEKASNKLPKENLSKGRVLSITPQGINVDHDGVITVCSLRGVLKKDKSQFKNLVTVGDIVLFEYGEDNEGLIVHVEPRKTTLSRADNLSRRKEQLIAANIDQVLITTSVVNPPIKPFLVDRYIIATRKGGMEPIIIVNKIDLLKNEKYDPILREVEQEIFDEFLKAYEAAGVKVIAVSAETGEGMELLREAMKDKSSVFSGQSGVGKSSLINTIADQKLKVGLVVEKTKKGAQTTTTSFLLQLPFGGWCIDTPGIKSFGLWDLKKDEIEHYFSEIYAEGRKCKFPDCTHIHESTCAVKDAVEEGKISELRYQSYIFLIESMNLEHKRR
jgi:ribosome biogenesis GTPase